MRISTLLGLPAAFAAGLLAARAVPPAGAQSPAAAMEPRLVNLMAMSDDEIGPLINNTDLRSRTLVATEWGTVAVQSGNVLKHLHEGANEVQLILDGTGSFWLGDTERQVKPGDLVVIPKGTPHAGSRAATGRFRSLAIKMPPQRPDDVKPVP